MEEIIAKSKASKALKFQQKEEDTMLHDQLDNDFKQIIEVTDEFYEQHMDFAICLFPFAHTS